MKKISAILLSLIMTCAVFTACGDSDSSSEKNESEKSVVSDSADDSENKNTDSEDTSSEKEGDSSKDDESKPEASAGEGELAKAYTDKLNDEFKIDMTVSSDLTGELPCEFASKDGNFYVKTSMMGINTEVYVVDSKAYMLLTDMKAYQIQEDVDLEEMGVNAFALDDSSKYVETKEEDGMTVEVYTVEQDSVEATVSYYFDEAQNIKKIVSESDLANSTSVFNSIEYECDDIVLPDLTDWTEMKDGEELDPELQMKLSLSMFGVTEEMVAEAGYTYAQLAEMDDAQLEEALKKMGVDLSGLMGDIE